MSDAHLSQGFSPPRLSKTVFQKLSRSESRMSVRGLCGQRLEGEEGGASQGLQELGLQRLRCRRICKSVYSLAGTQVSLASKKRGLKRLGHQHANIKSLLPTAKKTP